MHVLIPVKSLDHAKSRLRHVLDRDQRRALAERLLDDVLETLVAVPWIERVLVVTSNAQVQERASKSGAVAVDEPATERRPGDPHGPLNAALEAGRRWAVADGALALASLPVDLPLLPALDADRLGRDLEVVNPGAEPRSAHGHDARARVWLGTDEQRDGTNLLVQRPPNAIPFRYGAGSFRRHRGEAELVGAAVTEIEDPTLIWDLDHPDDPERWAATLAGDSERRRVYLRARERGTALRFLEGTAWGAPLAGARTKPPR